MESEIKTVQLDRVIIREDVVYGSDGYSNSRKGFLEETGVSFANK